MNTEGGVAFVLAQFLIEIIYDHYRFLVKAETLNAARRKKLFKTTDVTDDSKEIIDFSKFYKRECYKYSHISTVRNLNKGSEGEVELLIQYSCLTANPFPNITPPPY